MVLDMYISQRKPRSLPTLKGRDRIFDERESRDALRTREEAPPIPEEPTSPPVEVAPDARRKLTAVVRAAQQVRPEQKKEGRIDTRRVERERRREMRAEEEATREYESRLLARDAERAKRAIARTQHHASRQRRYMNFFLKAQHTTDDILNFRWPSERPSRHDQRRQKTQRPTFRCGSASGTPPNKRLLTERIRPSATTSSQDIGRGIASSSADDDLYAPAFFENFVDRALAALEE